MPMPMPAGDANGVGVAKQVGAGGGGGGPGRAHWPSLSLTARWVIFNPARPTGSRGGVRGEEFGECGNLEEDVPSRREWHSPG